MKGNMNNSATSRLNRPMPVVTSLFESERGSTTTSIPFNKEEIEGSISERFACIVDQFPDRPAITMGLHTLTYEELDKVSNQVAHAILSQHGEGAEPVVLLFDNAITILAAILGVLKSGKFYIALDASHPLNKLRAIFQDTQSDCILTETKYAALAIKLTDERGQILNLEDLGSAYSDKKPCVSISPDSVAVLFYTSGSTGHPKGGIWTHRQILHSDWRHTRDYSISSEDHLSLVRSYTFAASVADIFVTLLNGATGYPFNVKMEGLRQLLPWLLREEITIFHTSVSLFRQFLDMMAVQEYLLKMRVIILSGQTLYPRDVERFKKHVPSECLLINLLGSTEVGVYAQFPIDHQTKITNGIVPVGYAAEDKEIHLLDETGQAVGFNTVGEIAVGSRYLSPGYWRQPELTRQKFLPDPAGGNKYIYHTGDLGRMRPDGCLEYLGRKDFQMKIRGYRVVLTEIETALYHLDAVKDAVVVAQRHKTEEPKLVAYVVPAHHPAPTVSELRQDLAKVLPEYMLPSAFLFLDTLPLTSTGKVDRQALPEVETSRPALETAFVAPRNDLERQLALVCEELLGIHPIGVEDRFSDLGMHSIQALRLLVELEKMAGPTITPEHLKPAATIVQLANLIEERGGTENSQDKSSAPSIPLKNGPPSKRSGRYSNLEKLFLVLQVPYPSGSRLLAWFCGTHWAQHAYFPEHLASNMQRFVTILGRFEESPEFIRQHLMTNCLYQWRSRALLRHKQRQFKRWVTITGDSFVQQAYQQDRGTILLASHLGPGRLMRFLLEQMQIRPVVHLLGIGAPGKASGIDHGELYRDQNQEFLNLHPSSILSSLYKARQTLEQHGVVHIVADGSGGASELSISFLERQRPFRTGFAELAVMTGAAVIPVFTSLKITGEITVEFLNPLDIGAPDIEHQERVDSLLRQYASLLEQRWRNDPGNIAAGQLRKFLKLPLS